MGQSQSYDLNHDAVKFTGNEPVRGVRRVSRSGEEFSSSVSIEDRFDYREEELRSRIRGDELRQREEQRPRSVGKGEQVIRAYESRTDTMPARSPNSPAGTAVSKIDRTRELCEEGEMKNLGDQKVNTEYIVHHTKENSPPIHVVGNNVLAQKDKDRYNEFVDSGYELVHGDATGSNRPVNDMSEVLYPSSEVENIPMHSAPNHEPSKRILEPVLAGQRPLSSSSAARSSADKHMQTPVYAQIKKTSLNSAPSWADRAIPIEKLERCKEIHEVVVVGSSDADSHRSATLSVVSQETPMSVCMRWDDVANDKGEEEEEEVVSTACKPNFPVFTAHLPTHDQPTRLDDSKLEKLFRIPEVGELHNELPGRDATSPGVNNVQKEQSRKLAYEAMEHRRSHDHPPGVLDYPSDVVKQEPNAQSPPEIRKEQETRTVITIPDDKKPTPHVAKVISKEPVSKKKNNKKSTQEIIIDDSFDKKLFYVAHMETIRLERRPPVSCYDKLPS